MTVSQQDVNLLLLRTARHLLRTAGLTPTTYIYLDVSAAIEALSNQDELPEAKE